MGRRDSNSGSQCLLFPELRGSILEGWQDFRRTEETWWKSRSLLCLPLQLSFLPCPCSLLLLLSFQNCLCSSEIHQVLFFSASLCLLIHTEKALLTSYCLIKCHSLKLSPHLSSRKSSLMTLVSCIRKTSSGPSFLGELFIWASTIPTLETDALPDFLPDCKLLVNGKLCFYFFISRV